MIRELIGDGYLTHAGHLQELDPYAEDGAVLARLEEITVEQVDRKLSGGPCPGGG